MHSEEFYYVYSSPYNIKTIKVIKKRSEEMRMQWRSEKYINIFGKEIRRTLGRSTRSVEGSIKTYIKTLEWDSID
jgi:hypothetical protein